MTKLSRRAFLGHSSLTVVAATMVGSAPALTTAAVAGSSDIPEAPAVVEDGAALEGPLIAHVTDLQSGQISVYSGEREISIVSKSLAATLFNAAR